MGAVNYLNLEVPVFGNRRVLEWESDRKKSRQWLESAGIPMPEEITDPADIASPVRIESNVDEIFRAHGTLIEPTFVVTGNMPLVIRESLLPEVFDMGERVVEKSIEMFGGMTGPFCLETVLTDKLEFKVFEISARIVAGTNLFPAGSPYTEYTGHNISMGRRIALEIKRAVELNKLEEVLS